MCSSDGIDIGWSACKDSKASAYSYKMKLRNDILAISRPSQELLDSHNDFWSMFRGH
jgi:hypothetical protein